MDRKMHAARALAAIVLLTQTTTATSIQEPRPIVVQEQKVAYAIELQIGNGEIHEVPCHATSVQVCKDLENMFNEKRR